MSRFNYPSSKKTEDYDCFFGVEVKDPWRWLENPDSEETQAWIAAQNQVTTGYLATIVTRGTKRPIIPYHRPWQPCLHDLTLS